MGVAPLGKCRWFIAGSPNSVDVPNRYPAKITTVQKIIALLAVFVKLCRIDRHPFIKISLPLNP